MCFENWTPIGSLKKYLMILWATNIHVQTYWYIPFRQKKNWKTCMSSHACIIHFSAIRLFQFSWPGLYVHSVKSRINVAAYVQFVNFLVQLLFKCAKSRQRSTPTLRPRLCKNLLKDTSFFFRCPSSEGFSMGSQSRCFSSLKLAFSVLLLINTPMPKRLLCLLIVFQLAPLKAFAHPRDRRNLLVMFSLF